MILQPIKKTCFLFSGPWFPHISLISVHSTWLPTTGRTVGAKRGINEACRLALLLPSRNPASVTLVLVVYYTNTKLRYTPYWERPKAKIKAKSCKAAGSDRGLW